MALPHQTIVDHLLGEVTVELLKKKENVSLLSLSKSLKNKLQDITDDDEREAINHILQLIEANARAMKLSN